MIVVSQILAILAIKVGGFIVNYITKDIEEG